jgi:hypothetical protein
MAEQFGGYRSTPDPQASGAQPPLMVNSLGRARYQDAANVWLVIGWAQRPRLPYVGGEFEQGRRPADTDTIVYRDAKPIDVAATILDAFARHQFVAIVAMTYRYYDAGAASPSPTVRSRDYHPCLTGGYDCVGG